MISCGLSPAVRSPRCPGHLTTSEEGYDGGHKAQKGFGSKEGQGPDTKDCLAAQGRGAPCAPGGEAGAAEAEPSQDHRGPAEAGESGDGAGSVEISRHPSTPCPTHRGEGSRAQPRRSVHALS